MNRFPWAVTISAAVMAGAAARAQNPTPSDSAAPSAGNATIVLRASASASEVRFTKPPVIRVHLLGATFDSVHVLERRNLPDPVQPGVTYHDVYIAVEILGHLNAQCIEQSLGVSADTTRHDYCSRPPQASPSPTPSPPR